MTRQFEGAKSPMKKGALKRVFLALVVLLVASTVLVGAGSADTELIYSDFLDALTNANYNYDGQGVTVNIRPVEDDFFKHSSGAYQTSIEGTVDITIKNVTFKATYPDGGYVKGTELVFSNDGKLTLENCTFTERVGVSTQGDSKEIVVGNCRFDGNTDRYSLHHIASPIVTVTNSEFNNIRGGMYLYGDKTCVTVTGNTFTSLTDDDMGAVQFSAAGDYSNAAITLTGNTVDTSGGFIYQLNEDLVSKLDGDTIVRENTLGGGLYTRETTLIPVATVGEVKYTSLQGAIDAAGNGATIEILVAGTYTLPRMSNKEITINGTKDVIIDLTNAVTATTSTITFKGLTVKVDDDGLYEGIQHATKVVYTDCILNGTMFLYSDAEYTNCVFNVEGNNYNIWTYGNNVTFTGCTFNSDGKAVLVYNEGAVTATVTFNKCEFNDNGAISGKAAVEVGESAYDNKATYTIIMRDCTVNGFDKNNEGTPTGTTLWGNKNSMDSEHLMVTETGTKFTVNTIDSEHGKVGTNVSIAEKGDFVKVTATPDDGYDLIRITVTTASGEVFSVQNDGTFQMPAESVEVKAEFKEKPVEIPVTPTISIYGELSAEKVATPSWIPLTASLSNDDAAEYKWSVTDAGIIELQDTTGATLYYKPLKAGTTKVTVSVGGITKTVTITVFETVTPEFPATSTTTVDADGKTTITVEKKNNEATEQSVSVVEGTDGEGSVTIKDEKNGITKVIKGNVTETNNGATITDDVEVSITYAPKPASSSSNVASEGSSSTYQLSLTFTNETDDLSFSPELKPAVIEIAQKNGFPGFTPDSMITASVQGDNDGKKLQALNKNISTTAPNTLTFTIAKEGVYKDAVDLEILALHITDTGAEKADVRVTSDKDNWIITISVTTFSSYAYQATPVLAKPQESQKEESPSQGTSEWLTETPTPTPTEQPTDKPTDTVPTDIPTTSKPTEEPSSPGFGVLAALAGLGAVAALRRQ